MKEDDLDRRMIDKLWDRGEELEEIRENLRERKTERMQLRVTPTEKEGVEMMTELLGVSAADYLMHLHRLALRDIDRENDRKSRRRDSATRRPKKRQREEADESRRSRRREETRSTRRASGKRRRRNRGDEEGTAGVRAKL